MRRRNYDISQLQQYIMPACMVFLIFALAIKFIVPRLDGQMGPFTVGLVDQIWVYAYPGCGNISEGEANIQEERLPWMLEVILKQVPAYRYQDEMRKIPTVLDEDPAYEEYLENKAFYKEYEYFLRTFSDIDVGSENTGDGEILNEPVEVPQVDNVGTVELAASTTILPSKTSLPVIGREYIKEQLADYDFLMKHFYNVHSATTASRDLMKADDFLSKDFSLAAGDGKPQILIYHTHSQEEFADYHTGNADANIINVGTYLTELLEAKGYSVLHDTSVYDLNNGKLDRNKAYTYALDGITRIIQENPSIEVILDVHRDGVKEGTHLVNEVNGKPTAPIMFFNGLSQSPTGPIEYLQNPYREDNLAFSFQMQLYAEAYFPNFTRKIYLKGLRYNMHLRPRSALIEVGAQTNTFEEARNAMEPLAELLDMVLQTK